MAAQFAKRAGVSVALLSVVLMGLTLTAAAQGNEPDARVREARERFDRASQEYANGHFGLALADFEAVYEVLVAVGHENAALVLFNMARCYVELGRNEEAVRTYQRFLEDAPEGAPNIEVARTELRELRVRMSLQSDEQPPAGSSGISPVGPIVAGLGGAVMIAGAITGGLALAAHDDATRGCVDGHCPAELDPRADEAALLANVTDGLIFGGLAVAVTGVVLTFVLPGDGSEPASVAVACSSERCVGTVQARF